MGTCGSVRWWGSLSTRNVGAEVACQGEILVSNAPIVVLAVITAPRYYCCVIRSFKGSDTEKVWRRLYVARFDRNLQRAALGKLVILNAVIDVKELRVPPGNRLEKLAGTRKGQYSIRINQQWRICFRWTDSGPEDVEIVDYH